VGKIDTMSLTRPSPADHPREGYGRSVVRVDIAAVGSTPRKEQYMLLSKLRRRLEREEGFTLIELLVVLVIIAVLLAIAVPSYLGFKERAERRAAGSNVRAAIPAAEAYYSDHNTYNTMTATKLRASYDAGLAQSLTVVSAGASAYCLKAVQGNFTYYFAGPSGPDGVTSTACT
jgi:prepilin-type N-terminal cleavage/methylation domain-containing protein